MKIKYLTILLASALIATAGISAMAADKISNVRISIAPDNEDNMSPGDVYSNMEPEASSGNYYVDEYNVSKTDPDPKSSYTYTIDILPESGYTFDSKTDVSVYGATEVTIKSRSSSKITVKAKTYPWHVLSEPTNIKIDKDSKKATWDEVKYAKKYSVIISYKNKNGDEKETTKSVTKASIDLDGYIGKYEDVDVAVRAIKGTTEGDKYISNSDYVNSDGTVDDDNSDDEYTFNVPTAKSDGTSTSNSNNSSSDNSNSNSGPSSSLNNKNDGWTGSGNDWSYIHNGQKVTGWLGINSSDWYLMDSNGKMLVGWQYSDGKWYLLNTNHDGTYGKMLVGWHNVNRKWYYMNTKHDGTYGAMYANTRTPDGYTVGADGAWIQ